MVAGALVEGRVGGFDRLHAMMCQIYRVLESATKGGGHDETRAWPLLGLSDPDAHPDVHWPPRRSLNSLRVAQGVGRARGFFGLPDGVMPFGTFPSLLSFLRDRGPGERELGRSRLPSAFRVLLMSCFVETFCLHFCFAHGRLLSARFEHQGVDSSLLDPTF